MQLSELNIAQENNLANQKKKNKDFWTKFNDFKEEIEVRILDLMEKIDNTESNSAERP